MSNEARTKQGNFQIEARAKQEKLSNEQLVLRIQARENAADHMLMLWQQTRRFISLIAKRYNGYADQEDLEQEGYLALCEAVKHYDISQGVPFINYAAFWIRQGIQRYIDNCCQAVRIPVGAQADIRKYKKLLTEYRKYYGTEPTDRELCGFLYISREKLQSIKESARMVQLQSLDAPIEGAEGLTVCDTVATDGNEEVEIIHELDLQVMKGKLWEAVDGLPGQQPELLRRKYIEKMTLKDIGQSMGVGIERVRQIENKALRTLRLPHRSRAFRGYYEEYLQAACYHHVSLREFDRTWTSEVEREALGY